MVISSMDLKDGHVVQLKNGKELVLKRDDAASLIKEFDKYGEVALIDLDAAMGNVNQKGDSVNTPLLKSLLRKGNVRVGGGIRSVKRAKELVSLCAEKVIIGSAAWKKSEETGKSSLNTAFLDELSDAIGKQRIIIGVDALDGKIAIKGWSETINLSFIEGAALAEKYCSELLFTCIEKEGCMLGTNLEMAKKLRDAVNCRVVVAGGVSTEEETGKVSLKTSFEKCLDWEKTGGLIPVIAQDERSREVLMMGYANKEALQKTFESGKLTFFSRTRNSLWTKGETSGHFLELVKIRADCDRDTLLATVIPTEERATPEAERAFLPHPMKNLRWNAFTAQLRNVFRIRSPEAIQRHWTQNVSEKKSKKRRKKSARRRQKTKLSGKPAICCIL